MNDTFYTRFIAPLKDANQDELVVSPTGLVSVKSIREQGFRAWNSLIPEEFKFDCEYYELKRLGKT